MSAEVFGASLLQEVNEESLSSLLSDLRTIYTPQPRSVTGLEELDAIIEAYRYPAAEETRAQDISSDPHPPFDDENEGYYDDTSPTRNHARSISKPKPVIINITQPFHSSTTATSILLSHLTSLAILPPINSGKYGTVVHIDCLNTFSSTTLYNHVRSVIQRTTSNSPTTPTTTTQLTKSAPSHVHIIPCSSTSSLVQTLQELPTYLLDSSAHSSKSRHLSLLIITGLNHFTWQDRFNTELTRLEQINQYPTQPQLDPQTQNQTQPHLSSTIPPNPTPNLQSQILTTLKQITSAFDCPIIYTTTPPTHQPNTNPSTSTTPTPPTTPPQDIFNLSALLTLHPTRSQPPQFAPQMSIDECLRDRRRRGDALRNVRYWFGAKAGGLSGRGIERGVGRMGFGMRRARAGDGYREGSGWVFES